MSLMRPLFFENEQDKSLILEKQTYLWGDAFLVTPVTDLNVSSVKVHVPNGIWFDWWNGHRIQGNKMLDYPISLETIPVLVRAGSFVPMIAPIDSTKNYSSEQLTLHYYHDPSITSASGKMYEDDGKSADAIDNGTFDLLDFNAAFEQQKDSSVLTFSVSRQGKGYPDMPLSRETSLVVHNWAQVPSKILLGDKTIPIVKGDRAMKLASQAALFEPSTQKLTIKYHWHQAHNINIKFQR